MCADVPSDVAGCDHLLFFLPSWPSVVALSVPSAGPPHRDFLVVSPHRLLRFFSFSSAALASYHHHSTREPQTQGSALLAPSSAGLPQGPVQPSLDQRVEE
jgi:hypothetical protein